MVIIDQEKCIGCGLCVKDCIRENITLEGGKAVCGNICFHCGHCVAICPQNAVSIPEYEMEDVEACGDGQDFPDIDTLLHAIKSRRTIRHFKNQPVEREKLEKILQAGRYSPTGMNRQACRFVIVQDQLEELKKIIWAGMDHAIDNPGVIPEKTRIMYKRVADMRPRLDFLFRNAPAVIYVAAKSTQDACLAAQNMELAAVSQGLGFLYNGYLIGGTNMNPDACQWLELDDKPVAICMLVGYPDVRYKRTAPRRAADVRWK